MQYRKWEFKKYRFNKKDKVGYGIQEDVSLREKISL